jgi:hypothetical protein
VKEDQCVEQPLAGFDYSYWFDCDVCHERVNIAADLYERQTSWTPSRPQADFSRCEQCGTEVDVTQPEARPVLRELNDIALQDDCIADLCWYHSSPFENWPDAEAYEAEFDARPGAGRALAGVSPRLMRDQHVSKALHIGTYEAAIENMLRRRHDEDNRDGPPVQYWLHRVQIHLQPGDLAPGVSEELANFVGDVPLSTLRKRNARAVRYVNVNEAHGSFPWRSIQQ